MMNRATIEKGNQTRQQIYDFVIQYITDHGYPPSFREIGDGVGLSSSSSVHNHLLKMFADGTLETDGGLDRPRAIRVPGYRFVKEGDVCGGPKERELSS